MLFVSRPTLKHPLGHLLTALSRIIFVVEGVLIIYRIMLILHNSGLNCMFVLSYIVLHNIRNCGHMLQHKGTKIAMNSIEVFKLSNCTNAYIDQVSDHTKFNLPYTWQIDNPYRSTYKKITEEFRKLHFYSDDKIGDKEIASMVVY